MKPRRVILTIEVETDAPLRDLRRANALLVGVVNESVDPKLYGAYGLTPLRVEQVQANVVKR